MIPRVFAIASVILALVSCGRPESPSDEIVAARMTIRAEAAARRGEVPATVTTPPPSPPTVPRTSVRLIEVPRFPQVYVDQNTMLSHRRRCPQRTSRMLRLPRSMARSQGYAPHAECTTMHDEPEYRQEVVVHPEWIAYETALAEFQRKEREQVRSTSPNV